MGGVKCSPTLVMVAIQVGFAGLNVLSKLAMDNGMSPYVMIAYRQVVASLFLLPVAYFIERNIRMKITWHVLFQIFLCSVFGATINQLTYFIALKYTTPTIACALNNTLPAITFIMAVPFGMETVGIRTLAGQAKLLGTALCIGGSMLMTFYKGSLIHILPSHIHWRYAEDLTLASGHQHGGGGGGNEIIGTVMVIVSCVAYAVWFIVQAKMSKSFSAPYTSSAIMCSMAMVECLIVAAATDRERSAWALGWDIRLCAVIYNGLIGSGFAVSLMSWCIEKRGPLFVSMFNPLLLIIVAVVGWAVLDEKLYLGTAAGSVLIVVGLYMVLWGKGREMEVTDVGSKVVEGNGNGGSVGLPTYLSPTRQPQSGNGKELGVAETCTV